MSSSPWIHTNPGLRQVKLKSGRTVIAERLAEQHYLIWDGGKALTEVQCIPTDSGRWYWRGAGLAWVKTRAEAIQNGLIRSVRGVKIGGAPLENWSDKAGESIAKAATV